MLSDSLPFCGVLKLRYRRLVQAKIHDRFGHLCDGMKHRIGLYILALHMIGSAVVGLVTMMVPITAFWVAFVATGYIATGVHWYLLDGCCINPIENYFFGQPDAEDSCFVNAFAAGLGIPDTVVKISSCVGPLFIGAVLYLRYKYK
jgi:hypothetical protein